VFGAFVPTVEIELKNGDVLTARLPDPAATEAVVRKLGFGRDGKRVHAALEKPTRRLLHPLFAVGGYIAASTRHRDAPRRPHRRRRHLARCCTTRRGRSRDRRASSPVRDRC
jgi:hypothetical protein